MKKRSFFAITSLVLFVGANISAALPTRSEAAAGITWPDAWQASSAFYSVWSRADAPVVGGMAARSWLWGPEPFAVANEAYTESGTGRRLVEYLDKARMEENDPSADRNSNWFVTSGLLVSEMVTGRVQVGNNTFEARQPAAVPVAGDANSPQAPSYGAFAPLTGPAPKAPGKLAQQLVGRDGSITAWTGSDAPTDPRLVGASQYDDVTKHNIPAVFADWAQQRGLVLSGGRLVEAPLMDPLFVLGRPITEAYWADVLVAGAPVRVLVQLYERRALTYNPSNATQWRVEMANVGRAYFAWRYGDKAPDPAVSAEMAPGGLSVRGWNWPSVGTVSVRVDLAGSDMPLAGPLDTQPDANGRFGLLLPANPNLQGVLEAGANVRVSASSAAGGTALPLAGNVTAGPVHIEGVLSEVSSLQPDTYSLLVTARDGKEWSLRMPAAANLHYNEGNAARPTVLGPGISVSADGSFSGGSVVVSGMQLLSVSKTGAQFGYVLQADKKSIRVTGTGWPGGGTVLFTVRRADKEGGPQLGSAKADSRGNLTALLKMPAANSLPPAPLWLFAQVSDKSGLVASVAQPFDATGTPPEIVGPPRLSVLAASGEQTGGLGDTCWQGRCSTAIGVPVPGDALRVRPGEVLGLRSQIGPDPESGLAPFSFSGQLYAYPGDAVGQGVISNGTFYFKPTGQSVFSTGDVPGRPFSVSLPPSLASGKYILLLVVEWPGASGSKERSSYGFSLLVP